MARVLNIVDLQAPFHHPKALSFLEAQYKKYKCDKAICIGDPADFKFLKYMSVNDPHTAEQQHKMAVKFLKQVNEAFGPMPACECNHVHDRIANAAELGKIPEFMLKPVPELLGVPWNWKDHHIIDGVRYEHGHRYSGSKPHEQALAERFTSVVIGHHPIMAVKYVRRNNKTYFGMCCGALTVNLNDAHMGYGMKYSRKYAADMPLGCGVIIDGEHGIPIPFTG